MICYICNAETDDNVLALWMNDDSSETYDAIVEHYMLVRCDGPDEMFDADDNVVLCERCVGRAILATSR